MSEYLPLIVVGILFAYSVAYRQLQRAAQPLRLKLAERGNLFLSRRDVPPEARVYVTWLLDHAFSFRGTLFFSLFLFPFFGIQAAVTPPEKPFKGMPPDARSAMNQISRLHRRITTLNHPLLSILLVTEILLVVVVMLIADLIRGHLSARTTKEKVSATKEKVLSILESKELFRRAA